MTLHANPSHRAGWRKILAGIGAAMRAGTCLLCGYAHRGDDVRTSRCPCCGYSQSNGAQSPEGDRA